MAIQGILFDNQVPTARGLRSGFQSALTDGILTGCDISIQSGGAGVSINTGLIVIAGGIFEVTGATNIAISPTTNHTRARIKVVMDLTGASTTEEFSQVRFVAESATTESNFPALVQDNVNIRSDSETTYEMELCMLAVSSQSITEVLRIASATPKLQYGDVLPEDAPEGSIFLLKVT